MSKPSLTTAAARSALHEYANPKRAAALQAFFKTGPGGYGSPDDVFIGLTVPVVRAVVKDFCNLPQEQVDPLIKSKIHEERLLGLLILVHQFQRGEAKTRKRLFRQYMAATAHVNNWDLVDSSAEHVVGGHLYDTAKTRDPLLFLTKLAKSKIWYERRIAVLATFHFIRKNEFDLTLRLSEQLLNDPHDLIHKAIGWLLREVGKRDIHPLHAFLDQHAAVMPRTMLRYAIERLPEKTRRNYLQMRSLNSKRVNR